MANKPKEDNLDKDLIEIVDASFKFGNKRFNDYQPEKKLTTRDLQTLHQQFLTDELLQRLSIYIVRRDHLVKDAGVELGKELAEGNLEPEEEG